MRLLKILIALNGVAFIFYALEAFYDPNLFWSPSGSPDTVLDIGRAAGVGQLAFGIVQLGAWRMKERWGVELVAVASLVYAVGFGVIVAIASAHPSDDMFHQFGMFGAAVWAVVAILYVVLLYRERREV
jgi:peptidoglycan/LPS O-acetylase OafA/YrhL